MDFHKRCVSIHRARRGGRSLVGNARYEAASSICRPAVCVRLAADYPFYTCQNCSTRDGRVPGWSWPGGTVVPLAMYGCTANKAPKPMITTSTNALVTNLVCCGRDMVIL